MSVWVCVCVLARARWRTDLLFHTFPIGWLIGWLIHWLIGRWVDWLIEWVIAGGPHYARGQVIVNIVNGVRNWPFVLAKTKMTMWVWSKIHRCIHFTYMPWKRGQCGTSIAYAHKSFSLVPRPRLARLLETIGEGADLDFAREAGCQVAQICVLCIPWFLPLRHTFLKGVGSQQLGSPSSSCSDSWWWGLAPRCARWTVLWKMIRGMMDELGQSCIMIMLHPVVFLLNSEGSCFLTPDPSYLVLYVLWDPFSSGYSWKLLTYVSNPRKDANILAAYVEAGARRSKVSMQIPTAYNLHPRVCDVQTS